MSTTGSHPTPSGPDRRLGPLAYGPFRSLFLARTVSSLGDRVALVALAFAVIDFGGVGDLAIVILAQEIPAIALVLLGGAAADRLPLRGLMIYADAVRFTAQAATAWLVIGGQATVWSVAVLQAIYGAGTALFLPASSRAVPATTPAAMIQGANGLLAITRNVSCVAGPALGAWIVVAAGPGWGLAADAASFLAGSLFLLGMRVGAPAPAAAAEPLGASLRTGWHEFHSRSWLWVMVGSFGLFQLVVYPAFLILGPVVALDHYGGPGAWGLVLTCGSIGSVAGAALVLRLRVRRPLLACQALAAPLFLEFAFLAGLAPFWLVAVAAVAGWACVELGDALWASTLQRALPEAVLGRVSSFDHLGSLLLNPLGYVLVGALAGAVAPTTLLAAAALLQAALTAATLVIPAIQNFTLAPARTGAG